MADGDMTIGFVSEATGQWGYVIVTSDGRGHVAFADVRIDAQRECVDALGLSRRRIIGKGEPEAVSS
jgi:hypothetical protein